MEEITYKGLDRLEAVEVTTIQRISGREFSKIKRNFGDKAFLILGVKKINCEGRRSKYEINARVDAPCLVLHAEHSDWELQRVLHRTFDNLKVEFEHKFKKGKKKWPTRIIKE